MLVLQVDEQIAAAFKLWSDVTDLTFTPRSYGRFNTIIDNDEFTFASFLSIVNIIWGIHTNNDFTFLSTIISSVHIDIQFQSRHHGDADSFDGRGGVGGPFVSNFDHF